MQNATLLGYLFQSTMLLMKQLITIRPVLKDDDQYSW